MNLRTTVIAALLILLSVPAYAVVPGLVGPLQAILAMLPQVCAVLFSLLGSLLSMSYWRARLYRWRKPLVTLLLLVLAVGIWGWLETRAPASVLATATPLAGKQNWLSFRGAISGGCGTLDNLTLPVDSRILWSHYDDENDSEYISSPVAVEDHVYVGCTHVTSTRADGSIQCMDARDGRQIWRVATRHAVFCSPVVAHGRVYCGEGLHENNDASLYCLDGATGATLFKIPTTSHVESSPTLSGDRLLFGAGDDGVRCIDAKSGQPLWQTACGHCDTSPAVADDRVYVGSAYGCDAAICLDLTSGKALWSRPQDLPVWGHAAVSGQRVCFGLGNGNFNNSAKQPRGAAICLDSATGEQLWRSDVGDSVNGAMTIAGESVFFGSRDGNVHCLALADGKVLWKANAGPPVLASLVVQGEDLIVAGGDGCLYTFARADGTRRSSLGITHRKLESSPMLAGGRLYLGAGPRVVCIGR